MKVFRWRLRSGETGPFPDRGSSERCAPAPSIQFGLKTHQVESRPPAVLMSQLDYGIGVRPVRGSLSPTGFIGA